MENISDVEVQSVTYEWPEPLLFGNTKLPKLSPDFLPPILRNFALGESAATQTPVDLAVMLILPAIATALQGSYEISPFGDDYHEPVQVWTVNVLPPASRKSAVFAAVTSPLLNWEAEKLAELRPLIDQRNTERLVLERRIENLIKQAAKSTESHERSVIQDEIQKLKEELQKKPEIRSPRLFTTDSTPEQLQNLLADHRERMSVLSPEGGIFEVMSGLYTEGRSNIDVFLKGHAGDAVRVDRGSRTVILNKPALSFGLAVQPRVIEDLSKGSRKQFRGKGCLARFLYCFPDHNIGQRDVSRQRPLSGETSRRYESLIKELVTLGMDDRLKIVTLSEEARKHFLDFSQFIESKQGPGKVYEQIQDWTGKLPGAALRIAALCHVAEYTGKAEKVEISGDSMASVLEFALNLVPHAQFAFDSMDADAGMSDAKFAFQWIQENYELDESGNYYFINQSKLLDSSRFKNGSLDRVTRALKGLADRSVVFGPSKIPTSGRPKIAWMVNPGALI